MYQMGLESPQAVALCIGSSCGFFCDAFHLLLKKKQQTYFDEG